MSSVHSQPRSRCSAPRPLGLTFALLAALAVSAAAPAQAKVIYSGQLGATKTMGDDAKGRDGYGMDLQGRVGVDMPFPFLDMEAEAILGFNSYYFGGPAATQTLRVGAGFRGGVNFVAFAQGFVHASYGRQFNAVAGAPRGLLIDAGIALDLTAVPFLRMGIYGAYNHLVHSEGHKVGDGDGQWWSFGIQGSWVDK